MMLSRLTAWLPPRWQTRSTPWLVLGFALLLLAFHFIWGQFFPGRNGTLGHDWTHFGGLPYYLNDFRTTGLSWWRLSFNPGACHSQVGIGPGFPLTPEMWLVYLGAPPMLAVYLPFLLFAGLGFWGMFLLLRRSFALALWPAFLGAGLFMFNEFFAVRIIIGHGYLATMLLPWMAWLLARPLPAGCSRPWLAELGQVALLALVICMAWLNGMVAMLFVMGFALTLLVLLLLIQGVSLWQILRRGAAALLLASGVLWWSLAQTLFVEGFAVAVAQRQAYALQGFSSLWATLSFLLQSLFLGPYDLVDQYSRDILNLAVYQGPHELAYSIGPATALLLVLGLGAGAVGWLRRETFWQVSWWRRNALWLGLLVLLLLFPLAYATYSPWATAFWKRLPVISATTSPQRLFFAYDVLLVVLAAIWLGRWVNARWWPWLVSGALLVTVGSTALTNRDYYHQQPFDPAPAIEAYQKLQAGGSLPAIEHIGVLTQSDGRVAYDQMVEANFYLQGVQSMGCYIPNYSSQPVEFLKQLEPGPVWFEKNGRFNLKNPACNTWPKENNCLPGDHFTLAQREAMDAYIHYRPFPVQVPERLQLAGKVSGSFALLLFLLLLGYGVDRYRARKGRS